MFFNGRVGQLSVAFEFCGRLLHTHNGHLKKFKKVIGMSRDNGGIKYFFICFNERIKVPL